MLVVQGLGSWDLEKYSGDSKEVEDGEKDDWVVGIELETAWGVWYGSAEGFAVGEHALGGAAGGVGGG